MTSIVRTAAATGGGLLAAATRAVAAVRSAPKPLHPRGEVRAARLFRRGSPEPTGVPWLDEQGTDDVEVRLSRAAGLPHRLPDVHGLALRVHTADGYGDLLLATTGRGPLSRFLLLPSRTASSRPMTTLLPYRTPTGPIVLAAEAVGAEVYELSWARGTGDWQPFAVLRLSGRRLPEPSFDPVLHRIDGLEQYPAVRRLREPAYESARDSRA